MSLLLPTSVPAKDVADNSRRAIDLASEKIEYSQKGAAGIHLADLAAWIDEHSAAASRDHRKMYR
jgi:hypothetical protein